MKLLREIILITLSILIVVYGVKIYQRSTGKPINVNAIFNAFWNNKSTTGDIVENKIKHSTDNLSLGEQNEKDRSESQQKTEKIIENLEQKEKSLEKDMAASGKNNQLPIHNPEIIKTKEIVKSTGKDILDDSITGPIDAEDNEITKEILAGLLPGEDEPLPEPVLELMSMDQAAKINDIHQEVWKILQ